MAGRLIPVDRVVAAWNALLATAWLLAARAAPAAALWGGLHAAAALLPAAVARRGRAGAGAYGLPRWAREAYPWPVWILAWVELGALHRLTGRPTHDPLVAGLDLALFGGPWHRAWAAAAPWLWLQETAHLVYLSYYALILLMPVLAVARRRPGDFRDATLRLVTAYLGCFAVSLVLPVCGPRIAEGAGGGGLFAGVGAALRAAGDSPGTAFPSSHCAGSVMAALVARRAGAKRLAAWLSAWAVAVLLSTIYTGNHYVLDALAGAGWALLLDAALGPRRAGRAAPAARRGGATRLPAPAGGGLRWPSRS